MYYNQELGLCIEFGPVRVDSVRRGGGPPPPGSNPPCAGSRRRGLLPGLLVIACYLSFTPSSLKSKNLRTFPPLQLLQGHGCAAQTGRPSQATTPLKREKHTHAASKSQTGRRSWSLEANSVASPARPNSSVRSHRRGCVGQGVGRNLDCTAPPYPDTWQRSGGVQEPRPQYRT